MSVAFLVLRGERASEEIKINLMKTSLKFALTRPNNFVYKIIIMLRMQFLKMLVNLCASANMCEDLPTPQVKKTHQNKTNYPDRILVTEHNNCFGFENEL